MPLLIMGRCYIIFILAIFLSRFIIPNDYLLSKFKEHLTIKNGHLQMVPKKAWWMTAFQIIFELYFCYVIWSHQELVYFAIIAAIILIMDLIQFLDQHSRWQSPLYQATLAILQDPDNNEIKTFFTLLNISTGIEIIYLIIFFVALMTA